MQVVDNGEWAMSPNCKQNDQTDLKIQAIMTL